MTGLLRLGIFALALTALAACDSAEERAEKHFQNAQELLAKGDTQRAMVEFRNVFSLNAAHREARLAYAETARSIGNVSESYSSYLRIAEQFPDDMAVRKTLTEMAILAQNWTEAERHGKAILASADDIDGQEIPLLALEFRQAVIDKDAPKIRELTRKTEALRKQNPDSEILGRILVEGYLQAGEIDKALEITDATIAANPDDSAAYQVKATLLVRKRDFDALEDHLRVTIARFPDDRDTKETLIQLFAQKGAADDAEDFLREEVGRAENKRAAHIDLITFIRQAKGAEAALAEINVAIDQYENTEVLLALKAGTVFELGRPDEAVTILQSVIDNAEPSDETDRFRVTLAKILVSTGNEVGARQLVEAVLARDPNQVSALKMSATWLIEGDKGDEAIGVLRRALDQAPQDAEAMSLMATAHERNGDAQLAQDLLAMAVEASGNKPAESLRFARLLMAQERYSAAEDTLIKGLRTQPGHRPMLVLLGQVYLKTSDWSRAQGVENALRRLDTDIATLAADELKLKILHLREGRAKSLAYLEDLAEADDGNIAAKVARIRARLSDDRGDEAVELARNLVEEMPGNTRAILALGNTQFSTGDLAGAEATLRPEFEITTDPNIVLQFARVLGAQGKSDDAQDAIEQALVRMPDSPDLLWAQALLLEQQNRIDEAIAVYEGLYEKNSNSLIVANNLASLLGTYIDDQASLDRAFAVARRLKGTTVPPFQDTYGWLIFRRGNVEEALTYLRPAAAVLDRDPIVQYHFGRALEANGFEAEALPAYEAAVSLAGEDDPRRQIKDAIQRIQALSAKAEE